MRKFIQFCFYGVFVAISFHHGFAQKSDLNFRQVEKKVTQLDDVFASCKVFEFNATNFYHQLTSQRSLAGEYTMSFGDDLLWKFHMEEVHIINDETTIYTLLPEGKQKLARIPDVKTYKGTFADGRQGYIRLTLHDDFLYANIKDERTEYFIEPMKYYDKTTRKGSFVMYNKADIKPKHKSKQCFKPNINEHEVLNHEQNGTRMAGECYKVKLALLADYSMYTDASHSGLDAVIDHVVGVMNNVQANYEYNGSVNFTNGVNYEISEIIVSTCPTCDPISSTQNPTTLLTEFSAWVDMNGFYHPFHAAHFWTNRDFIGPTVGVAFQQGNLYCNQRARAVLEDWSSNAGLLKTMVAHEVAHNFNGIHDGTTGMILSPTVTTTDTWSSASKTTISGEITSQSSCLTLCTPPDCARLENVVLNNVTTSGFDLSWEHKPFQLYTVKVRESGNENFIMEQTTINNQLTMNPQGFGICKSYEVFVYNNCGAQGLSAPQIALFKGLISQGCAEFTSSKRAAWSGVNIGFINNSLNANQWNWNLGNGQTSTQQAPSTSYSAHGKYDVSLTVNGGSHTKMKDDMVHILPNRNTPYTLAQGGNFESNDFDFGVDQVEGTTSLWEYGTSTYVLSTQGKAWKTKLNSDIPRITTKSALLTPRFIFTNFTNYNLSFDLSMETVFCNAPFAVQLQYSTDNGTNWTRLGGDSFYDAYPGGFCSVNSQIFSDGYGWTYSQQYSPKSIDVSFLSGQPSVVFRFVASIGGNFTGGYAIDGALIDNFQITASGAVPLPLDVYSLKGKKVESSSFLEWSSTITSQDIEHFCIYRTMGNTAEFTEIGKLDVSHSQKNDFAFIDQNPAPGTNFYKVGARSYDGKMTYSNITKVVHSGTSTIEVFPNPGLQGESIRLLVNDDVEVTQLQVSDVLGRKIDSNLYHFDKNNNNIIFNNEGLYVAQITLSDGLTLTSKMIVL
ncbi:MAG: T9SS type A sorting domain-containing protein [Saprospiraceae bacterium]|nr:T9SS type A sorting domain-containing protein [Saprospiraceae bacterium]